MDHKTNKIHSENEFAKRVVALGLSYTELSELCGYKVKTLYNISSTDQPAPKPLNAYMKLLELLAKRNELVSVLKELKAMG